VIVPEDEIPVNAPVLGAVLPMGGGEANKLVKPAPVNGPAAAKAPTVVGPVTARLPAIVALPDTVKLVKLPAPPPPPTGIQAPVPGLYEPMTTSWPKVSLKLNVFALVSLVNTGATVAAEAEPMAAAKNRGTSFVPEK
jgi:hypothetical protein